MSTERRFWLDSQNVAFNDFSYDPGIYRYIGPVEPFWIGGVGIVGFGSRLVPERWSSVKESLG